MIPLISVGGPGGQIVVLFSQDGRGIVLSRHEDVELFVHYVILPHILLLWSVSSNAVRLGSYPSLSTRRDRASHV